MATAQVNNPKIQTSLPSQSDLQVFDEGAMDRVQSYLTEIGYRESQRSSSIKTGRFMKFAYDRESKILSFTGNIDKEEVPARDYETGEIIADKFVTRYQFECYDITSDPSKKSSEPQIWERGVKDAKTILYYLSKKISVLEVTRNGQPGSKNTTYTIVPYFP